MVRQSFEYSAGSAASLEATATGVPGARAQTSANRAMNRGSSLAILFIVNLIHGLNYLEHIAHLYLVYYSLVALCLKSSGATIGCEGKKGQLYKNNHGLRRCVSA